MTRTDLIRWEPFLRDTIAGRFNPFFSSSWPTGRSELSHWSPPVDIYDSGTALILEAELPGFKQDDIDIRLENNVLMLSGERRTEVTGDRSHYLRAERTAGTFSRSFALPASVDPDKIEARYDDGILTLTLPKTESAMPRRIDVEFH